MHLVADRARALIVPVACVLYSMAVGGSIRGQTQAASDWAAADVRTARLSPSAFAALSSSLRDALSRRGCTIPQTSFRSDPHNVIVGAFTGPEARDVAVLCSRQRVSSILVFRGGSTASVDELSPQPDIDRLQVVSGDGRIGFSREIAPIDAAHIREYLEASGGAVRTVEHAGIEDRFVSKTSMVWYWDGVRWIQIPGADDAPMRSRSTRE